VILQEKGHPPGAIVVGLGSAGGLTPDGLAQSFEHAVLAYAGEIAAHAGDPADAANVTSASITTLLIGSGKGGMSVPDSVRALLKGALRARASLANATAGPRVQLDSLEFCELYYDTCVAAHRALCDAIERRRFAGKIDLVKHVTSRRGGRQRVAFENASETWETLSISAQQDGSLRFQTSDGRARVLVTLLTLLPEQKERLDSYVRQATNTVSGDATVAEELYRQLLPVELKRYTPGRERLLLTVDETAAAYPWELLRDDKSPGTEPLAARQPLIRKLATHAFRTDPVHATQEDILVIGNPMTPLPPLAGAVSEARWIERQFTAGRWSVTALIGTPSAPILKALGAKPYRILHVAAHGVFEHEKESGKVTGVVLGDGVYLVPMQLDSMPYVPELAFLNCCHLGRITATQAAETAGAAPDAAASAIARPQLAANLATQLIQMGARAVVAAGWKVEDRAAVTFASTFYQEMLAGRPFGEAVHAARYETYVRHPNVNTWGAYQCYGNPDYVLSRGEAYAAPAPESFSSVQELVTGISNLCHDADTMSQLGRKELQRRLRFMLGSIQRDEWLLEPEVLGVLARAYAQLGMFDEAVDLYAQLYRTGVSSFGACEQLANLRVRSAVTRWKRDGAPVGSPDHAKLINTILRAVRDLKRLPYTPPMPSERRALIASAYKRLSQISQGRDRISALTKTAAAYRRAHKTARKRLGRVDTYPLHNWLAARIVLYKLGHGTELEDLTALLDEGEKATVQDEQENVTFWSGVARGDALLIKHYGLGDLAAHVEEIIDAYHRPWSRGGSAKDLGSVIENIAWLIDVSASQSSDRATARLNNAEEEAALSAIQQAVTAFLSEGFDPAAQETLRADNAALDGAF
jgi:pentatricopeptide repeat protein